MNELPTHLGGLQHLEPDVIAKADDIYVQDGVPHHFVQYNAGQKVGDLELAIKMNVYRRIPVAKQGDNDDTGWKRVAEKHLKYPATPGFRRDFDAAKAPLPTDAKARKATPIYSGCIAYFPDAIAAVAQLSQIGNEQHNPGKPLHWDRSKSGDEADALMRHLLQKDEVDKDGVPHSVKVAWRGLAAAQKYLEAHK